MVAVAFPETQAVEVEKLESTNPFDAFPGVEMRDDQAQGAAMFASERFAVVLEREENTRGSGDLRAARSRCSLLPREWTRIAQPVLV